MHLLSFLRHAAIAVACMFGLSAFASAASPPPPSSSEPLVLSAVSVHDSSTESRDIIIIHLGDDILINPGGTAGHPPTLLGFTVIDPGRDLSVPVSFGEIAPHITDTGVGPIHMVATSTAPPAEIAPFCRLIDTGSVIISTALEADGGMKSPNPHLRI
jgi:hypothetical protein